MSTRHQTTTWARMNGQAEMRENVRAAIKAAGLTQREVVQQLNTVPKTHLLSFLGSNCWFRRDALEAVANLLKVPAEELVGGSIFADQRDRYSEFDHMPPSVARIHAAFAQHAAQQAAPVQTRALCCACGTLRQCSTPQDDGEPDAAGRRATAALHCTSCEETTRHALLVLGPHRDTAENRDHAPSYSEMARDELAEEIERLAAFNVDVRLRRLGKRNREEERTMAFWFDDSKSRWQIDLEANSPPRVQVRALNYAWKKIATDDFGDLTWDPRATGTACTSPDSTWADATDELMKDLTRYLPVEKRRTAEHVSNEAAR